MFFCLFFFSKLHDFVLARVNLNETIGCLYIIV